MILPTDITKEAVVADIEASGPSLIKDITCRLLGLPARDTKRITVTHADHYERVYSILRTLVTQRVVAAEVSGTKRFKNQRRGKYYLVDHDRPGTETATSEETPAGGSKTVISGGGVFGTRKDGVVFRVRSRLKRPEWRVGLAAPARPAAGLATGFHVAKPDPQIAAHLEWLGFVKPTGLVVSPVALVRAGVILNRRDVEGQERLRACIDTDDSDGGFAPPLPDFRDFAGAVLGWSFSPKGYAGTSESPLPEEMDVTMPDGETVRPDYAVRTGRDESEWQLLVLTCQPSRGFDQAEGADRTHAAMERLLRHTGVTAGLIFNGKALRLVSAPKGESSGWINFRVADMVETAGRPISTAMRLLLGESRLLTVPKDKRLAALIADSRKFQNEVSKDLSEQVLHALYELLRGFQAAHDASGGRLLEVPLRDSPDDVYRGLLTLTLRLIFLLYAEERDLLPQDDVFLGAYSLAGLHKRLREDAALHADTMDQRYGAYAQLLFLFRMVHDGARSGAMILPPRHGTLFQPDLYRFLEGRGAQVAGGRQIHERIESPLVSDGTVYRVLEKLLVLKGERISYRALDVEHIGSVYETMMGFRLEAATGQSVAIKAAKTHGAPATIDLDSLLEQPPEKRIKWVHHHTDRKLADKVAKAVRQADTIEALHAALGPVVDADATPDLVASGAMVLQPNEERRRSGSHYTPRELTEPIVRDTLKPVLDRLRTDPSKPPTPDQVLDLKVCDPAMGSGAFSGGSMSPTGHRSRGILACSRQPFRTAGRRR